MTNTIILGAGPHAKVVIATLMAGCRTIAGVYDDDPDKQGGHVLGIPVLGSLEAAPLEAPAIIAVGSEAARKRIAASRRNPWITATHPAAIMDPSSTIGPGAVVFAGAVVQPEARIGAHAVINTGATIDHDCVIGDFAQVAPGANLAGNVTVGEGAFIGTGASVCPGVAIGAWSVIGAGAVVTEDIPARVLAVGIPAQVKRSVKEVEA